MPRAPKPQPVEPVNTYGLKPGYNQLLYDRYAFARRFSIDTGAPTRPELFKRISDKLLPGHFEWHDWTNRIVNTGCEYPLIGNMGCSNCVDGNTRILNPITGKEPTIRSLCERGIAPVVMTLEGPREASVPFLKGVADLFEVVLENGQRFTATAEHRVLVSISSASLPQFCPVSDLQISQYLPSYELIRQPSIWEPCPSVHGQDEVYFQKTTEGYTVSCSTCRHLGGEQPHFLTSVSQSGIPLRDDVQEHTHYWHRDALDSTAGCILGLPSSRLSTAASLGLRSSFYTPVSLCYDPEISSHADQMYRHVWRLHSVVSRQSPLLEPSLGFSRKHQLSLTTRVSQSKIVSIRKTLNAEFYDLSVPGPEHYFAQGTIHHNSAKTYNWAGFVVVWWLCAPEESSVTFVSTSIKSLRRRGWSEVQKCYTSIPGNRIGNMVDSKMLWQAIKGDDKHAIIGKAVEEGPLHKVADDIKGVHTRRQAIVVDEANAVPEAIWEAITNLYSYPEEFLLIALANPRDRLSVFSRFCEPENGWQSVGVDTEEWDGKPQSDYGNMPVRIIRFDAEKSPNIIEGRIVSKHLPTKEKVEAARIGSGGQTPAYWTNFRGFPPPEGLTKTVFTESALVANDAFGRHQFTGKRFSIIGAFDPAFGGGDRPALRFAKMGEVVGHEWGLEWFPPMMIPIDSTSKNPVHFQLAEKVRQKCARIMVGNVEYSCPPENLAVDATGEGGGFCDILQRTWSPNIIRIEFGGRPSEDSCSLEDIRPASEVYQDKTTEMHFRTRDFMQSGQLKGVDRETAVELCNREFDDSGRRIKLMSKKDYRLKFNKSPDWGDCGIMISEVARRKGFRLDAVGQTVNRHQEWDAVVAQTQQVFEQVTYGEEELEPVEEMW